MVSSAEIQAVVMAGGKGSRLTDLTGGVKAKCLLPVANYPLIWFPLKMLQDAGFQTAIVAVPESVKSEVGKIPEKYNLSLKLDIVGIKSEDWGTGSTLRNIEDRLVSEDILIVSGDLICTENIRELTNLHRAREAGLTMLLSKPPFQLKNLQVPGSKSNKYKSERDLIGLMDSRVCLFTAEADVEDKVHVPQFVLRQQPRMQIHTNLQDAHLYIIKKWVVKYVCEDSSISTIKGELVPKLVKMQFKAAKSEGSAMDLDRMDKETEQESNARCCHATITDKLVLRVNNIPAYWEANRLALSSQPQISTGTLPAANAQIGARAQIRDSRIGADCNVADKTTINNSAVGTSSSVQEKVTIINSVIMEGVTVCSGVTIQDSILCDGVRIEESSDVKNSILGRGIVTQQKQTTHNQILLDKDRMMEV